MQDIDIELVNEPIFENDALQAFYTAGANVVGAANSSGINTTVHGKQTLSFLSLEWS
jgi:aryl-phospho-beta-D-glucosidase BglC (GH1 family)